MEWYGAFALLVTLVWLYLEILTALEAAAAGLASRWFGAKCFGAHGASRRRVVRA